MTEEENLLFYYRQLNDIGSRMLLKIAKQYSEDPDMAEKIIPIQAAYQLGLNGAANRLKAARESCGYTIADAAQAAGITLEALKAYEAGNRIPRDSVKVALADLYRQPVPDLFF